MSCVVQSVSLSVAFVLPDVSQVNIKDAGCE